ncbi:phage portal protein [Streptomyces sp. 796.1]|uniref:phage portal protein n=1 Tax=Streptomyces sp. 796.1 TaxID=3163029 RepID=UPI0039C9AE6F
MGWLFRRFGFASSVASKSWSEPEVWSPQHALNLAGGFMDGAPAGETERIENDFESYVNMALKRNGPVAACMLARQMVFSEARFQWRRFEQGRPSDLFGSPELGLLERPWPGGTTGELLAHMEQDVTFAGNFWATIADDNGNLGRAARGSGRRIVRMRPDWVTLIIGSKSKDPWALDARVLMIVYEPRGSRLDSGPRAEAVRLLPDEVCHYSPIPDPVARFRGMSWITPVVREVEADISSTAHKRNFFENAAVPNMVVKFDKDADEDAFDEFVAKFNQGHRGAWNAYKTLFLMGGADVTPLSYDFKQLDFAATVGKGESRIAAAAGVPASWVGFSEGMQGSSLNSGNYNASRRRFADGTMRPLWRMAAASLEPLLVLGNSTVLGDGRSLWYDTRDIAFLREDETDRAEIMRINLNAIDAGIKSGFENDAVVEAVRDNDVTKLFGRHTGLVSVQMQPPAPQEDDQAQRRSQEEAAVRQTEAAIITSLTDAGFELDSIVAALESGDWGQLAIDPVRQRQAEAAAVGAERATEDPPPEPDEGGPPGGRKPPAADKPEPTAEEGGDGP